MADCLVLLLGITGVAMTILGLAMMVYFTCVLVAEIRKGIRNDR